MDIQTQSYLLSAIVCLAIAIGIQIRGRRTSIHVYFVILNAVLVVWNLGSFIHNVGEAPLGYRVSLLAALAIPWTALRFFQAFLAEASRLAATAGNVTAIVSLLLTPFVLSPLYDSFGIALILLVYVFGVLYLCVFLIYRRLRLTESRVEAARLWYLVIGGLIAITFSLTDYLPKIDVFFPTFGNVFTVIFMFFLSQILIQYRLLDLNEFFGKIAVLGLLVSLLAAIYGALIYFVGDQPGTMFFTSLVASFVVLILFDPLRTFVEERITRYNLRERFDLRSQLQSMRREMANVLELGPMVELVFSRLENTRRITHGALYLLEHDAQTYKCIGHVGPQPVNSFDAVAGRDFIDRLRGGARLVREDIEDEVLELQTISPEEPPSDPDDMGDPNADPTQLDRLQSLLAVLDELKAGVVFPILSEHRLIGLFCVWDARVKEAFTQDELGAMQQLAQQVAIVFENSRLVEKLRERDRLAALGEMAAGLAHEIRNPLGAIKGAAQLLDAEAVPDEESREFIEVIVEEVDRLNNVVSQFLDYARQEKAQHEPTDLNPCVERTLQLLRPRVDHATVTVVAQLASDLPQVRGDAERLTQVFLNLGINAIDAMASDASDKPRRLTVSTSITRRREPGLGGTLVRDVVEVSFADTGRGMTVEEQRNIFIPFYTTKQGGTGLGLPICQRIVRGFGGTLEVHSQLEKGSTFAVQLPLWGDESITGTSLRRERTADGARRTDPGSKGVAPG